MHARFRKHHRIRCGSSRSEFHRPAHMDGGELRSKLLQSSARTRSQYLRTKLHRQFVRRGIFFWVSGHTSTRHHPTHTHPTSILHQHRFDYDELSCHAEYRHDPTEHARCERNEELQSIQPQHCIVHCRMSSRVSNQFVQKSYNGRGHERSIGRFGCRCSRG